LAIFNWFLVLTLQQWLQLPDMPLADMDPKELIGAAKLHPLADINKKIPEKSGI
jgi:hypothetical protein